MTTTNVLMRKRIALLFLIMGAILLFLIGRLAWIQFVKGDDLREKALKNRMDDIKVPARRGTIYDRNGRELVISVSSDTIYAIPPEVKNPEETAEKLAEILGLKYEDVYKKLTKKSNFEYIKRKVPAELAKEVKKLELAGIDIVEESQRSYPNGNLASHILGFVGIDNYGLNGIEVTMEKELAGTPGRIVTEKDSLGREIPQAIHQYYPPVPGNNLILTIDETIQYFAERELDKVMETTKAKGASVIVMDPKTGGILAMANRPDFNPGKYADSPQSTWRNSAIWLNYEPGSTFKVITAAAALEEGTVTPETRFYEPGYATVSGERIKCWYYPRAHGAQSFEEVVQNSCNPGFIEVGLELGKERFYKYIRAFGLGQKTGIPLAGEAKGILYPEKQVKSINLATMSIGQSISVTPIQLVTAISAVANDGVLMKPQLVKEIRDTEGNLVKEYKPEPVREVISKSTARQLRGILEKVISHGTGSKAFMEEYPAAGKTGTAQKAGKGGYMSGKYVASFAGFAPVDNPRIAVLVVIDEPEGVYYGGQIAAPVFQSLARDTLRYLNVPPRVSKSKLEEQSSQKEVVVPDLTNMPLTEAKQLLQQSGLNSKTEGSGDWVLTQKPKAGEKILEKNPVILYLGSEAQNIPEGTEVTVPDLSGLTMKEAGKLLGALGLKINPEGTGVAVRQETAPGTKVKAGATIKVIFLPPDPEPFGSP